MTRGMIIFLNGASSSGKTVLAQTLQHILDEVYLHLSIDSFLDMLPQRYLSSEEPEGLSPEEVQALAEAIPVMVSAFHRCIGTLATSGVNVIVDHVLQERGWLEECVEQLADLDVLFIGVRCPLQELERRERERERQVGTARQQHVAVHAHGEYDVEVDTATSTPLECALQVKAGLQDMGGVSAFRRLREMLSSEEVPSDG